MTTKEHLRKKYLEKRNLLNKRRQQRGATALTTLAAAFPDAKNILSYASFGSELNSWLLNQKLAAENRLILPKMIKNQKLALYKVLSLDKLEKNKWGILEPDPNRCEEVSFSEVELAFIPGVAFDNNQNRIGYGKGYYDRLLTLAPHIKAIGVGFDEQLSEEKIPTESHDISLNRTLLF